MEGSGQEMSTLLVGIIMGGFKKNIMDRFDRSQVVIVILQCPQLYTIVVGISSTAEIKTAVDLASTREFSSAFSQEGGVPIRPHSAVYGGMMVCVGVSLLRRFHFLLIHDGSTAINFQSSSSQSLFVPSLSRVRRYLLLRQQASTPLPPTNLA